MAVTERTPNDIIDRAYRIIGIRSKDRALSGDDTDQGLYILNQMLDNYSADSELIAYYDEIQFPLVIGQESYTISDQLVADVTNKRLVYLKYVNLIYQQYRYPVWVESDAAYYRFTHDETVTRRPGRVFLQQEIGQSKITFFEKPDQTYTCLIKGKFILEHLELSTIITQVPIAYHRYLEYALANELRASRSGAQWNELTERNFQNALNNLRTSNDNDIELEPDNIFVISGRYRIQPNAINVI